MRIPLRYRLLLVPMLVFLGTAAATAYAARHAARSADHRIEERVQSIRRTLRGPPTFPLTLNVLQQLKNLSGAEFSARKVRTFADTLPADDYREYAVELFEPHPDAGTTAVIYFPESVRREEVNDAVRPVLALGIGAGLAATVLSLLMSRRLVAKIRNVEAGTRAVASGQFAPLPLPQSNDELRDLVQSVNAMAGQLAANEERLKQTERLRVLGQVSGGLAHQLRNAAAGAKLALQLHTGDPDDPEPLLVAQRQLMRMESILQKFLELDPQQPLALKSHDLRGVIAKAVGLVKPQADHLSVNLTYEPPEVAVVKQVDAEQFEHLMENLLVNALEAAGAGGEVNVILTPASVEVTDSGPGVPVAVLEKLFEPFASSKPGGIGLGLTLARQIARQHGFSLRHRRIDDRTVFEIRFVAVTA